MFRGAVYRYVRNNLEVIEGEHGSVGVLVNNAGYGTTGETDMEAVRCVGGHVTRAVGQSRLSLVARNPARQCSLAACLRPLELTHVQFVLLATTWWLSNQAGPPDRLPSQRQISDHAATDAMMTSQVLRGLEARGLVTRTSDRPTRGSSGSRSRPPAAVSPNGPLR